MIQTERIRTSVMDLRTASAMKMKSQQLNLSAQIILITVWCVKILSDEITHIRTEVNALHK